MVEEKVLVESPGRINLIGEHVDYNGGSVLPGAIDKKVEFTVENIPGNKCFIESNNKNKMMGDFLEAVKRASDHFIDDDELLNSFCHSDL